MDLGEFQRAQDDEISREQARDILEQTVKGDLSDTEKRAALVGQCPDAAPITLERVHFEDSAVVNREGDTWAIHLALGEPRQPNRAYTVHGELDGAANGTEPGDRVTLTYVDGTGDEYTITGEIVIDGGVAVEFAVFLDAEGDSIIVNPDGPVVVTSAAIDYAERTVGTATALTVHNGGDTDAVL